ncbi:ABC transporter ATP-binding protein [Haloplanus ruber]|uniref:ABC transporter ATP-binding protein n=1 Tax=Haloplanus ruber TaxID=869892 RepID=A0ABD6CU58_9EURY|nr:ABC transporter ATP-binding protein [Haloplanus ruber]
MTTTQQTETNAARVESENTLLRIEGLTKTFGSFTAVDGVDLSVPDGELHSIIGPNGAGKTTLFNMIAGSLRPTAGTIHFRGTDITAVDQDERARRGVSRAFQITQLFPGVTVHENLRLAAQADNQRFNPLATRNPDHDERARGMLDDLDVDARPDEVAANLSHGDKKKLEIGMALVSEPTLLLLDEPTSGVAEAELPALLEFLTDAVTDLTVLLIEHDVDLVLELSDRITVLDRGEVIARGDPEDIVANERVQNAYMGGY